MYQNYMQSLFRRMDTGRGGLNMMQCCQEMMMRPQREGVRGREGGERAKSTGHQHDKKKG